YAKIRATRRPEEENDATKSTNLKKILKKSIRPAGSLEKDIELVISEDMNFSILFNKDIYNKADVITVATFIHEPDISIDKMLNPCRFRGMTDVREEVIDKIVHYQTAARVNTVFLKDGKIRIVSTVQYVRI